jgi:hypothetical protein
MKNRSFALFGICTGLLLFIGAEPQPKAQDESSNFRVNVVLVQLNVAVTDHKGNYIAGLRPEDFTVSEDRIPQRIATFEEGNGVPTEVAATAGKHPAETPSPGDPDDPGATVDSHGVRISRVAGANVFILFDTSNYMYRGFVYAQDAITQFVRSMDDASKIAFYSYSRNLSRAAVLTADRFRVVKGVRSTVAGDDAALYNCLLLTVEDAAQLKGRKAIVVFSNGPDNASGRGIRAHEQGHRRQGILRRQLARGAPGIYFHPRGPGTPLHAELLSAAESKPRLALHQGAVEWKGTAEISHPHPRWLQAAATPVADRRKQRSLSVLRIGL